MAPRERQTMLFSATMTEDVQQLVHASLRRPVRVAASIVDSAPPQLTQEIVRLKVHLLPNNPVALSQWAQACCSLAPGLGEKVEPAFHAGGASGAQGGSAAVPGSSLLCSWPHHCVLCYQGTPDCGRVSANACIPSCASLAFRRLSLLPCVVCCCCETCHPARMRRHIILCAGCSASCEAPLWAGGVTTSCRVAWQYEPDRSTRGSGRLPKGMQSPLPSLRCTQCGTLDALVAGNWPTAITNCKPAWAHRVTLPSC